MKINVISISKPEKDCYAQLCDHFFKMSKRFAVVTSVELFNAKVTKAQDSGREPARKIYDMLFEPWLESGFKIALDPAGKVVDTTAFSKLLENRSEVSFFIGGAYGHGKNFLDRCDATISLSNLTMSHKVAKVVLCEQIYRALTILHNHPYHK